MSDVRVRAEYRICEVVISHQRFVSLCNAMILRVRWEETWHNTMFLEFLLLKMSLNLISWYAIVPAETWLGFFPDTFAIKHVSELSTDARYNCAAVTVLFKWISVMSPVGCS